MHVALSLLLLPFHSTLWYPILQKSSIFSRLNTFTYVGSSAWSLLPFSPVKNLLILWDSVQQRGWRQALESSQTDLFFKPYLLTTCEIWGKLLNLWKRKFLSWKIQTVLLLSQAGLIWVINWIPCKIPSSVPVTLLSACYKLYY